MPTKRIQPTFLRPSPSTTRTRSFDKCCPYRRHGDRTSRHPVPECIAVATVRRLGWLYSAILTLLVLAGPALGQVLRVVTYNTANDLGNGGADTNQPTVNGPASRVLG